MVGKFSVVDSFMEKWQPGLIWNLMFISFVGCPLNLLDVLDHEEGGGMTILKGKTGITNCSGSIMKIPTCHIENFDHL